MYYKLYFEEGNYRDITTGEPRNLQSCIETITPEGINVGWTWFDSDQDAMTFFNIELIPNIL